MSAVNLGSQYITWDYKHPAKAADFNTLLKGGFPPGIYEGGSITKVDNTSVNVNPFIAYIQSGTDKIVKIETRATFTVEDLTPTNNVIYMTYPWSDVIDNWANFEVRAESDPPLTNEIVLGIAKYSGTILDHIDYSETPLGNIQKIVNTEKELIYNLLGLTSTTAGVMILKGGEVTDAGSGNVNIAECYAVTEDDEGELRIIYVTSQSNLVLPTGWDDGRQIWVSTNYIKNGSYSVGSMFTDSAPISSRVVLDSFYMNGTTFAEQSGRSPVHEPRDNSVGLEHLTEALRDFLNNITPQDASNYITNGNFEVDASSWSTYKDTPVGITPIDGTGGTPTISLTRNTTLPMFDTGDGQISKASGDKQGEGVSNDFTIDNGLQGQTIDIEFYYKTSSDYASNDMGVFIYDITNDKIITPTLYTIAKSEVSSKFLTKFVASADSVEYRLIFHIRTTNALAYTFNMDNVKVQDSVNIITNISTSPHKAGFMQQTASANEPEGMKFCDGSALSRTGYSELFAEIGTTFGVGDGSTTFNIPDMRSAHARGVGLSTQFTHNNEITLGQIINDQMQKITGSFLIFDGDDQTPISTFDGAFDTDGGVGTATTTFDVTGTTAKAKRDINIDSSNSPDARTSSTTDGETAVKAIGLNWIIKLYNDRTNVQVADSQISPDKAGFSIVSTCDTIPNGWLEEDGSEVEIGKYPHLYANIGTTYNRGDETTGYFRLPLSADPDDLGKDKYVNLSVKNGSTADELDITADELQIGAIRETTFSETVDKTVQGVNGRDQVATFGTGSWVYVYTIAGAGKNSATVLSANATSPDLSTISNLVGYTEYVWISRVFNNSGSNFDSQTQRGNTIFPSRSTILSLGSTTGNISTTEISDLYAFWGGLNIQSKIEKYNIQASLFGIGSMALLKGDSISDTIEVAIFNNDIVAPVVTSLNIDIDNYQKLFYNASGLSTSEVRVYLYSYSIVIK